MAVNPNSKWPTQTQAPDANYPYGSAQDITTPGDGTGTPWEADLLNDVWGLLQKLLNASGITPSGNPDTIVASDYYNALVRTIGLPHRGYLGGLQIRNASGDPTNDITLAVGECVDSTNAYRIAFTSEMTKRIDAVWAAGTGSGGFPSGLSSGTPQNNTWYHFFVLVDSTGVTAPDAGFDTSLTATNLLADATNHDKYRRIGSVYYNSGIAGFRQYGDRFIWKEPASDYLGDPGASGALITVKTPTALNAMAMLQLIITANDSSGTQEITLFHGDNAAATNGIPMQGGDVTQDEKESQEMNLFTNTSSQIFAKNTALGATVVDFQVFTHGYMDRRGRDD